MKQFLDIALIIISAALILSVILQSKGAGLGGGLTGADTGGVFTARRGIERVLFWITIALSVVFFALVLVVILITG
jgi:preprotein translocase subunit SecG